MAKDRDACPICDSTDEEMTMTQLEHVLEHMESYGLVERWRVSPRGPGSALRDFWTSRLN